jgi:hypothetical protein
MVGGIPQRIREDGREGVDPPELIVGDSMRMGSIVSLISVRSLSVGFLLKGGEALRASLKRSVIVLGVMPA